jgi:hypothetical protein
MGRSAILCPLLRSSEGEALTRILRHRQTGQWRYDISERKQGCVLMASESNGREVAGRLWDVDPFSGGRLRRWLFTTKAESIARRIEEIIGGDPWGRKTPSVRYAVLVARSGIRVEVGRELPMRRRLIRGSEESPEHLCDGFSFLKPMERAGEACQCPVPLGERMAAARSGEGPRPDVGITFRLVDDPNLGTFQLDSVAWSLFNSVIPKRCEGYPRRSEVGELLIRRRTFTTRSGMSVQFAEPVLVISGSQAKSMDVGLAA